MTIPRPEWRDNHPDRYGPIEDADMVCISGIDERVHFIQVSIEDRLGQHPYRVGPYPAKETACGVPMPEWREDPTRFPMGGVVDCPECLEAMRVERADGHRLHLRAIDELGRVKEEIRKATGGETT